MGSCTSSLFRRFSQDGDGAGNWATRRSNPAAIINHQKACKSSDFIKAFSVGQAFHSGKGDHRAAPAKLNCSSCGQFIVEAHGEQKFYACASCWKMGHALGICTSCFQNERYCLGDESTPTLPRRTSNGSMTGSVGVETVVPPPLAMEPSPPSSDSELDEIDLPGAVVEEKVKKTPSRRRASLAKTRGRRASASQTLETEELPDSPTVNSPLEAKGKVLSSQNSMNTTQLSTQGSMSSLKTGPRRASSQLSLALDESEGSPSPTRQLRRLSSQELHASGRPAALPKMHSAPNLKRRMSLPPISADETPNDSPKPTPKPKPRRMSSVASMKSAPDGGAGAVAPTGDPPDAAPKRKPARRMSTQASMKSTGTANSGRRTSEGEAKAAARPGTGKGRRNSSAVNKEADAEKQRMEEAKQAAEEQRRKSNASQRSVELLHQRDQAPLPSGLWYATFIEGRKKHTRKEERHLIFTSEGKVGGSGQWGSCLEGRFKLPNVQWTETYGWGTIKVKVEVCKVPLRLEGSFETSDQGSGFVTFLPADSGI